MMSWLEQKVSPLRWILVHAAITIIGQAQWLPTRKPCSEQRGFTAEELVAATQGYSESNVLGEGAHGVVYKGILSSDDEEDVVAVKKFRDVCSREALLQEVQILRKLRHRNLVRIRGCVLNLDVAALVLDFMPNGSLEQFLHRLNWCMFTQITIGVANALSYLHQTGKS